ncbi:MAG: radical SAM protein [Candidatus Paceibacterota bacterium]
MYKTLCGPIAVQVEVTEMCNDTCRHCYNFFRHDNYVCKTMSEGEVSIVISELQKYQVVRGVITGGEPLIVPDIFLKLAEGMASIGMRTTVNTNLILFNKAIGTELLKIGTGTIMTSLIGDTPELHDFVTQNPGSWKGTVNGIELAKSMGFRVLVNMVLTKWNIHRVREVGNLVGSLGANTFGATRACAPGPIAKDFHKNLISIEELRESLKILYELKEKWDYKVDIFEHYPWCALGDLEKYSYLARRKCTAGITSCTIGADGELRPCGHSSMRYGNVFSEGLSKPWMKMNDWRKQIYSGSCIKCSFFNRCTGGCPTEIQNSLDKKDHHCTSEEDVISLPINKEEIISLDPDCIYKLNEKIVLRKEEFGGTIGTRNGEKLLFVDKKFFETLLNLRDQKFSIRQVSVESAEDLDQVIQLFSILFSKKMITEGR